MGLTGRTGFTGWTALTDDTPDCFLRSTHVMPAKLAGRADETFSAQVSLKTRQLAPLVA
jgi:hypothetical protein